MVCLLLVSPQIVTNRGATIFRNPFLLKALPAMSLTSAKTAENAGRNLDGLGSDPSGGWDRIGLPRRLVFVCRLRAASLRHG